MGIRHERQKFVLPADGLENCLEIQINDIVVEIVPSHTPQVLPMLLLRQTSTDRGLQIPVPEVASLLVALHQAAQRAIRLQTVIELADEAESDRPALRAPGRHLCA